MITIEAKGNRIFLFGRNEDNNVYCNKVEDFRPYFYVEDKEGTILSIDKEKLKKINCEVPYEVIQKREQYPKHFEADIPYTNRFIIDRINNFEEETIRKCYIDIETKKPLTGYDDPFKASSEITCIGVYDNFLKEYKQFVLKNYTEEKEMLKDFIKYVIETDPDMFIAWNGDGFDFPFLLNRMNKLKINTDFLARRNKDFIGSCNFKDKYKVNVEGRILFDLMYAYQKWSAGEGRESFSLDYISEYEGVGNKEKYKGSLDELYEKNINKFLSYNLRDVELLVLLDEKLRLIEFFDTLRKLCFCKFEDVFMNSKLADCLCLKYAKEHNFVLPSAKRNERERFQGAIVQDSIPGLHNNIACVDMQSLYPSLMIGFNLSYETILDKKEENCINGGGKYFFKKERGIIPSIVKPLLDKRKEVKNKLKEVINKESREFKTLDMEQYTLKTIANSFYGVLGSPVFRLYKREVASSITYLARMTITEVKRWFEEKGFKSMYGDSVTGDTIIRIDDKSMKIEDFWNMLENSKLQKTNYNDKEYYNIETIKYKTLSITEKGYQKKNIINKIMRHKTNKDLYEIETVSGKKIIVTEDHSLIVKRNNKQIVIKPTELNIDTDLVYTYIKPGNKKGCKSYNNHYTPKKIQKNKVNPKNSINLKTYFKTHKNWAYNKTNENSEVIRNRSKKVSIANLKYFKNNEEAKSKLRMYRLKQQFPRQETKLEKYFELNILQKLNINYKKQTSIENYCKPDFVILDKKIAIFVDGDFWHANPKYYSDKKLTPAQLNNLECDNRQNKYLKDKGWKVIRYFEDDIYNNKNLLNEIKEIIK